MKAFLLLAFSIPAFAQDVPVELAYRNAAATSESDRRTVVFQGIREGQGLHFEEACGRAGENCECLFYVNSTDPEPLRGTGTGVSDSQNELSCLIPGGQEIPDQVRFAQVRLRTGVTLTGLVFLRTQLTLQDVLGRLPKENVRGIFRYTCDRTFFEGEGVSENQLTCLPGQHLGVLNASYHFYTYRSGSDSDLPSGDIPFADSICNRNSFLRYQCTGNTPDLRFGIYKDAVGPFQVNVQLTRGPEGDSPSNGFAAMADDTGRCPLGMEKANTWKAHPASITEGSLDGKNPPSNFLNTSGALDDTVLEVAQPSAFLVIRQASQMACDGTGDCSNATFSGTTAAGFAPYSSQRSEICVIPASLLGGIF